MIAGQAGTGPNGPVHDPSVKIPALDGESAELGAILGGVVRDVIDAQAALDEHARESRARTLATPAGAVVIPPLWYTFSDVTLEVELAASLTSQGGRARLSCRTCSKTMTSLHGRSAATDVRVRLQIAPQGLLATRTATAEPAA